MIVDFGPTASDYAAYRVEFPDEFFARLATMDVGAAGQRVVDLGTGTGAVARGFARRGCVVTGLDPSRAMLDQAQRLDAEAGVSVTYRIGNAEGTGLDGGCGDVVAAGQCWHWFDRPRAAAEALRLLVPGGALVICHMDYLPLPGNVCGASEALILEHNRSWAMAGGTGIHADWTLDAAGAGFTGIETFSFDLDVAYSHDAWRGRMRSCNGVGATLSAPAVAAFDVALAALLATRFSDEPLVVAHRVWALVATRPSVTSAHDGCPTTQCPLSSLSAGSWAADARSTASSSVDLLSDHSVIRTSRRLVGGARDCWAGLTDSGRTKSVDNVGSAPQPPTGPCA